MSTRPAKYEDTPDLAVIYNEGIEGRTATFETRPRSSTDVGAWLGGRHPVVVVEKDGRVVGFAAASSYRSRECYDGIAEFSVYVSRSARRKGVGREAMQALIVACEEAGFAKLVSRVFTDNAASRALLTKVGCREVGIYERHARLDGVWRDVVIVERLLAAARAP